VISSRNPNIEFIKGASLSVFGVVMLGISLWSLIGVIWLGFYCNEGEE
jgi:hypothetical protein